MKRKVDPKKLEVVIDNSGCSTQEEFGKEIGVSQSTIANWLSGLRQVRSVYIDRMLERFNLKPQELLTDECLREMQKETIDVIYMTDEMEADADVLISGFVDQWKDKNRPYTEDMITVAAIMDTVDEKTLKEIRQMAKYKFLNYHLPKFADSFGKSK